MRRGCRRPDQATVILTELVKTLQIAFGRCLRAFEIRFGVQNRPPRYFTKNSADAWAPWRVDPLITVGSSTPTPKTSL